MRVREVRRLGPWAGVLDGVAEHAASRQEEDRGRAGRGIRRFRRGLALGLGQASNSAAGYATTRSAMNGVLQAAELGAWPAVLARLVGAEHDRRRPAG
jgi:hypothetical protein